jgi:hypothetical protein
MLLPFLFPLSAFGAFVVKFFSSMFHVKHFLQAAPERRRGRLS